MATVDSDTTWLSLSLWNGTGNNSPPTNWETTAFVDSSWTAAAIANTTPGDTQPGSSSPIWVTVTPYSRTDEALFRKHFTASSPITGATISVDADDHVLAVYVNGHLISATWPSYHPGTPVSVPDSDWVIGDNVIAIHAQNHSFATGANFAWVGAEVVYSTTTYCQYGTQLSTPGTFVYYLTPGLIDTALATSGEAWAAPFLTAFWFTSVNASELCGNGPPASPNLTIQDFIGPNSITQTQSGLAKVWQWLLVRLWAIFCQCTPAPGGSPPPVPYPTPGQPQPPGVAPIIMFSCDGTDICTILNQLGQAIGAMQQSLRDIRSQIELIQRQHVPFAYVPGALHTGLTDAGTFDVQGILGLSIEITTDPGYLSSTMAPVASTFKWGEIALGTADGFQARRIITHNPHLYLDIDGDITQVAYLFSPGVVANILELIREP